MSLEAITQYLRGTLDLLVLGTLRGAERHGYGIAVVIAARTGGVLQIEDGALYQCLHRLEARGYVASKWGHAETGKRARFYSLTAEGRRRLRRDTVGWQEYAAAVQKVLEPA